MVLSLIQTASSKMPSLTLVHSTLSDNVSISSGLSALPRLSHFKDDLVVTQPVRRLYALAAFVAVPAGLLSGLVKLGWEVPFPARTPEQNLTTPAQAFAEALFGLPSSFVHQTYTFNGQDVPYVSLMLHLLFSICFVGIYCVVAEKYPQIKLWQGIAYGLAIWVAWHLLVLPAFGATGAPWDLQMAQHASEIPGHVVWMWTAELVRRDLRNRVSHQPDAERPLTARFR
jgi:putative membrane protein